MQRAVVNADVETKYQTTEAIQICAIGLGVIGKSRLVEKVYTQKVIGQTA
jgi:hypothetical protein